MMLELLYTAPGSEWGRDVARTCVQWACIGVVFCYGRLLLYTFLVTVLTGSFGRLVVSTYLNI